MRLGRRLLDSQGRRQTQIDSAGCECNTCGRPRWHVRIPPRYGQSRMRRPSSVHSSIWPRIVRRSCNRRRGADTRRASLPISSEQRRSPAGGFRRAHPKRPRRRSAVFATIGFVGAGTTSSVTSRYDGKACSTARSPPPHAIGRARQEQADREKFPNVVIELTRHATGIGSGSDLLIDPCMSRR